MRKTKKPRMQSEEGMATIELVPMLFLFVLLISYTLGAFGVVHTGILHSISARAYAFETFRNRSNVTYFRSNPGALILHYRNFGTRIHTIVSETRSSTDTEITPSERPIRMAIEADLTGRTEAVHNEIIPGSTGVRTGARYGRDKPGVNPAWVMVQYGICINSACGG